MSTAHARRRIALVTALAVMATLVWAAPAGAEVFRSRGTGQQFFVSWTEYDPDDALGILGNTHVGYLSGWSDQYGTYFWGNVTDFECEEGEVPWGGHGVVEAVADEAAETADAAATKAVEDIIDSGAALIDADTVIEAVQDSLSETVPALIEEEVPNACDYLQDRFLSGTDLDGNQLVTFTVDMTTQLVTVSGNLLVTGGGHGEPQDVLGMPPITMTISGGEWWKYESSWKSWSEGFAYSYWQAGTDYYGGTVSGAIGAMGFDDDADDVSHGGFGSWSYRTVERIRG